MSFPDAPWHGRCFIIGEVAQAHDGSLGMAHSYIDAIAEAGADAVKFQTHIAAAESTAAEPWRTPFSSQDATRFDYWQRMEFPVGAWHELKSHSEQRGLRFLSSPFSLEAVDLLDEVGVAGWKIASGEINNLPALERMAATGLPILLSSGMSDLTELDRAVDVVRAAGCPLTVLQCTSAYPCPPEKVGLNVLEVFRQRYGCPTGLSDHSGTIYPALAACTLGAAVIEVHVTMSREMFGPDVPASVTTDELRQLVEGVRFIETMLQSPVDKDRIAADFEPLRDIFTKSVVAASDLAAGTVVERRHLAFKKPGTGIPPHRVDEVIGAELRRSLTADEPVREDDLQRASG